MVDMTVKHLGSVVSAERWYGLYDYCQPYDNLKTNKVCIFLLEFCLRVRSRTQNHFNLGAATNIVYIGRQVKLLRLFL